MKLRRTHGVSAAAFPASMAWACLEQGSVCLRIFDALYNMVSAEKEVAKLSRLNFAWANLFSTDCEWIMRHRLAGIYIINETFGVLSAGPALRCCLIVCVSAPTCIREPVWSIA